jgi:hypothetical protein
LPCLTGSGEREIILNILVQPRASRTRITGLHDGNLRLAITSPPVEGQANRQVVSFVAKLFRVAKSAVRIIGGEQGRTKRLAIAGVSVNEAAAILTPLLGDGGT